MLSLSIKDGDGFTIGHDIIVTLRRDERGREVQVHIAAPTELKISRVDRNTAQYLHYKCAPGGIVTSPRCPVDPEVEETLRMVRRAGRAEGGGRRVK